MNGARCEACGVAISRYASEPVCPHLCGGHQWLRPGPSFAQLP